MCGFAGIISNKTDHHKTIHHSANAIKNRGVTLHVATHPQESYAYARLPTDGITIDTLEHMSSKEGTFLFNGLITNTRQLVTQFALPEECSESDYLALKEGIRRDDIDFLEACEGMFAGASITPAEIMLFRDSIGVKPLYYVTAGDMCAFASEIKALQSFKLPIHEVAPGTVVSISRADFTSHIYYFSYQPYNTTPLEEILKHAKHLGFRLTHVPHYTDLEALETAASVVYKSESPHARVTKVALLYDKLAKEIQKNDIHIVIGGEGADELFYGYHRFIDGLTDTQTERCFKEFYAKVFPVTLLQRFDRIFAHHQIEGRVPYLNQAVIAYAHSLPTEQKIKRLNAGHISKLPLRQLAKEIGLPQYIYDREKEKMTAGATGQANESQPQGFLEAACRKAKQMTFSEFVQDCYQSFFQSPLQQSYTSSEESIMHYVQRCKSINNQGEAS